MPASCSRRSEGNEARKCAPAKHAEGSTSRRIDPKSLSMPRVESSIAQVRPLFRGVLSLALAVLVLSFTPGSSVRANSVAKVGESGVLDVEIVGIRRDAGRVRCALYRGGKGFPGQPRYAHRLGEGIIRGSAALCRFPDLPPGDYAIVAIHDEDDDRRLAKNALGIPREGWGVSRNVGPRLFSPPRYQDASFRFEGGVSRLRIQLRY